MPNFFPLINDTVDFFKASIGFDMGTKLYPINPGLNLAVATGVPVENMPAPLYSFPEGCTSITFPVEANNTPQFGGERFDHENPRHIAYIEACTKRFNEELQNLKTLDRCLEASFGAYWTLKIIQYFLKDRPYAGYTSTTIGAQMFAMQAFSLTDEVVAVNALFNFLKQRQVSFQSYYQALERLMHNMAWSCGYQQEAEHLAGNDALLKMVLASAEVLTIKQIKDIIADPIEQAFLAHANAHQTANGYNARRLENNLALYGTKAINPYYFAAAPIAWTWDVLVGTKASLTQQFGLFQTAGARHAVGGNNPVVHEAEVNQGLRPHHD